MRYSQWVQTVWLIGMMVILEGCSIKGFSDRSKALAIAEGKKQTYIQRKPGQTYVEPKRTVDKTLTPPTGPSATTSSSSSSTGASTSVNGTSGKREPRGQPHNQTETGSAQVSKQPTEPVATKVTREELTRWFSSSDEAVRLNATATLWSVAKARGLTSDEVAIAEAQIRRETSLTIQTRLIQALGFSDQTPSARLVVRQILKEGDPVLGLWACQALATMGDYVSIPAMKTFYRSIQQDATLDSSFKPAILEGVIDHIEYLERRHLK